MPLTRHLGIALVAGLLLGLMPGTAAAGGGGGTSSSVEASVEVRTAALSPKAVFAAFESNLAGPAARPAVSSEQDTVERAPALPERSGTFAMAAALAQETASVFRANLTDSTPRALTPPTLSVAPDSISLAATVGPAVERRRLEVASLGGTVNTVVRASILNGRDWLRIVSEPGSVTAGTPLPLVVEVDYGALGTEARLFQGLIQVTDLGTGYVQTVPVAVALSVQESRIELSDSSVLLTIAGGGAPPPPQTLRIFNRGAGVLNWAIPSSIVPPWLHVSPLTGSAGAGYSQASQVTLAVNDAVALGLPSGVYQVLLPVEAPEANNSPQLVAVTLQRVPGSTPPTPGIQPGGLAFVARQGGADPAPQDFTVINRGGGSLTAQFNASTATGGNWLSISDTGVLVTPASGPLSTQVTVNPEGLPRGFYRGTVRATFSSGETLDVDVLLIVTPAPVSSQRLSVQPPVHLEGCTPDEMHLIADTIGNGASLPVSFPKVLVVSLIDSCGEFVDNATVVASAEGIAIPMQPLGNGTYSGTWAPAQQSAASTVTFAALHPTLPEIQQSFQVSTAAAAEGIQLPVLATAGVVEAAGFTPNRPLAPGGFITLFGSRFTTETAGATQIPLERELAGVRVRIGDIDAPLHFVSPAQINAVLPVEFDPGADVSILVSANGVLTAPQSYLVAPAMPGIFVDSTGTPAVLRFIPGEGAQAVTPGNPARIGDILEIFATGLGETEPPVASGDALSTASALLTPVSVEIGGIGVPVLYQGLAPNFVGLYQVNVQVTDNIPTGDGLQIRIIQNGIVSNSENPATINVVQPQ